MENKIFVCAHCNKVDTQTRSWSTACKLHAIETTEDCVITTKGKYGLKALFYDPNPMVVQAEYDRRERIKAERAAKRAKK